MLLSFPEGNDWWSKLETRDGLGIWDVNALAIKANKTQSFIDGNTNAILIPIKK
jgi:hypothetical protein